MEIGGPVRGWRRGISHNSRLLLDHRAEVRPIEKALRPLTPVRTLYLDERERRFETWFDEAMASARKAIEETKTIAV